MIRGITIQLGIKTISSYDDFGAPIYTEEYVDVDNVLVAPVMNDDIITSTDLTGKKTVYEICIPKGDTHEWTDTTVKFFGQTWKTYGDTSELIEALTPLSWNKKIKCERYE